MSISNVALALERKNNVSMTKILITGATGFIGRHLISNLSSEHQHYSLRAAVRNDSDLLSKQVEQYVIGDFMGRPEWGAAVKSCEMVIHLAGITGVEKKATPEGEKRLQVVNVESAKALAEAAVKAGVKRFVFLSSVKVCGDTSNEPIAEDHLIQCEDGYARSKYLAEQQIFAVAEGTTMDVVIVRPPLVYGPGVKGNFSKLISLAGCGWPLPIGGVENQRTLCGVDNLNDFIIAALEHPRAANEVFCVGDGKALSTVELIQLLGHAQNKQIKIVPYSGRAIKLLLKLIGKNNIADRLFGSLVVCSKKAEKYLGWQPRKKPSDAILDYFKDQ